MDQADDRAVVTFELSLPPYVLGLLRAEAAARGLRPGPFIVQALQAFVAAPGYPRRMPALSVQDERVSFRMPGNLHQGLKGIRESWGAPTLGGLVRLVLEEYLYAVGKL